MDLQWTLHANKNYEVLDGYDGMVRVEKLPHGYLWCFKKVCGYSSTIEIAREWVEALAEHSSIPPKQRWLGTLPQVLSSLG